MHITYDFLSCVQLPRLESMTCTTGDHETSMYGAQKVAQLISRWTGLKEIRFYIRLPDKGPTAESPQDCSKTIMGALNSMSQLRSLYISTGTAVLPLDKSMILSLVTSCRSLYRMSFGTSMCTISMNTLLTLHWTGTSCFTGLDKDPGFTLLVCIPAIHERSSVWILWKDYGTYTDGYQSSYNGAFI
jgi:hypothetical protein